MNSDIISAIKTVADKYELDFNLVQAIVMTESSGDPCKIKFEPGWKYFYNVDFYARNLHITQETESQLQAFSWGLMQVMGTVSRELGYLGPIQDLSDIEIGLDYGCKKLKRLVDKYGFEDHAIAAYNAGSVRFSYQSTNYVNQQYVDTVKDYLYKLRIVSVDESKPATP